MGAEVVGRGPEDSGCSRLFEAALPDLYRRNAFRVLGLAVTATVGDVRRQQKRLRMMEKLGISTPKDAGGCLPLGPSPDEDDIRGAMQRLNDPGTRLIDEFFWFWPRQLGDSDDEVLELLVENRVQRAHSLWLEYEKLGSSDRASTHNLAVLYHAVALDLEHKGLSEQFRAEDQQARDRFWWGAYRRWKMLLNDEAFWSRLTGRIRELDDPRLTTGLARRIRSSLPKALLLINARLAARAAERCDQDETQRHYDLMCGVGFDASLVDEALRDVLRPVRERIRMACERVVSDAEAEPARADRVTREFIDGARPLLATIDLLLPPGHPVRDSALDEAAVAARTCIATYGNESEDWWGCLELSAAVLPFAARPTTRNRLADDTAALFSLSCWSHMAAAQETPSEAGLVATDVLREMLPLLKTIDRLLPAGHPARTSIKEQIQKLKDLANRESKVAELKRQLHTDQVYDVAVSGEGVRTLQACTCCMGAAELEQQVTYSCEEVRGLTRYNGAISLGFPLCAHCRRHQSELSGKCALLVVLASTISVAVLYMIGMSVSQMPYVRFVAVGAITSAVLLAALSLVIRVVRLGDRHACRGRSVSIEDVSVIRERQGILSRLLGRTPVPPQQTVTFRFWNPIYADAFAEANRAKVAPARMSKYSRGASLLRGRSAAQVLAWTLVLALVGNSVLYAVLGEFSGVQTRRSRQQPPARRNPPPSVRPPARTQSAPSAPSERRRSLEESITAAKTALATTEAELEQLREDLETLSSRIGASAAEIEENYESRIDRGLHVDKTGYRRAIDSHNALVDEHNQVLADLRSRHASYEVEVERVNGMVGRYNRGER